MSTARTPDGAPLGLAAEYEQLRQMQLGHSHADIRLRIRRANLAHLAHRCPYCGAEPWERCHVVGVSRLVSQPHSARNWLAVDAMREQISEPSPAARESLL